MPRTFTFSFTHLRVWQDSHRFAVKVAEMADSLPLDERFCLASQLRRASLSVPNNIAEGHSLWGTPSYLRHVRIALGSLGETASQLMFAGARAYFDAEVVQELLSEAGSIHRQMQALIQSLQKQPTQTRKVDSP